MAEPFPTLTVEDLAEFAARPRAAFSPFADSALAQALLLFKISTCLSAMPDNQVHQDLIRNAILGMADQLYLANQYREAQASPFNNESIGSYSYSKTLRQSFSETAAKISSGGQSGVQWFDIAVELLGQCDVEEDLIMHGGIEVFEHDIVTVAGVNGANRRMLSPQDMRLSTTWGLDPSSLGFVVRE
jgi:hypothetical protein